MARWNDERSVQRTKNRRRIHWQNFIPTYLYTPTPQTEVQQ